MTPITFVTLVFSLSAGHSAIAQTATPATNRICLDVAHQQRFWDDPADMAGKEKQIERVKYMTGEAGVITDKRLKISYHGARTVTGGTPFGFNDRSDDYPFGTFKEVEKGGKVVVMGDGMVSLYMTN